MDEISRYQIEQLMRENEYLAERLDSIPAWIQFLCLHGARFVMTVKRLARASGLAPVGGASPAFRASVEAAARAAGPASVARARNAEGGRILIAVTNAAGAKNLTGIPRVVREICRAGIVDGAAAPVTIEGDRFCFFPDLEPVAFAPGDRIVLLDAGWNLTPLYSTALKAARAAGAEAVLVVYDLVPIHYPGVTTLWTVRAFEAWYRQLANHCEAAVAISRATALEFAAWLERSGDVASMSVGWFHLGADLDSGARSPPEKPTNVAILARPYFLSVGTMEPRKGYAIALDAMEQVWARGLDVNFVIVGRPGWSSKALVERIRAHPEKDRRLFWLDDVNDAELARLYASARALVYPSIAEGFGLPLIEAAHFGAPVVASDIPVFREIGGERIEYFRVADAVDLADALARSLSTPRAPQAIPCLTWRESARALFDMVRTGAYQMPRKEASS